MKPSAFTRKTLLLLVLTAFTGMHWPLAGMAAGIAAEPLRVGIFPRRNATQTVTLFKPLLDHLGAELGREVQLITAKDFPAFWQGVEQRRFDLVHFNQYHYIKAHAEQGYDAVLANEEFGEPRIAGALYVRADRGIEQVQDLEGKTLIFGGDYSAMMSYIIPTDLLRAAGLGPGDYTEKFAPSPPNSVFSVYFKQADAAGAGEVVRKLPSVANRIDVSKLRLLALSEPIAHLPWAVRQEMDAGLKQRIAETLSGLGGHAAGRALLTNAKLTGLQRISDADYDPSRAIIRRVFGEQAL